MTDHAGNLQNGAARWFGKAVEALDESEARVLRHAKTRRVLTRDPNEAFDDGMSFGERLADKVATFGGSWTFIILFCALLVLWTAANVWLLTRPFDPYPFIFLNLMLSMLAALQAPVIMMSQNRQSAKDRHNAQLDYEVNLKAEIEIMALHEKLDRLRDENIMALLAKQQEQITLLTELVARRPDDGGAVGAR
ncbi:cyclic nucleotide-binding protein [Methylopila jiangsuensis]|uniref:Cyclic nucleotide-binding protein n=1 Tax=Methylopila jiangsuensis TaxID=586230 RepID=A0A9W6JGX7_9HYPH|nr:DUF1003 domain-containing protein [Methylopila jiangsuensis]MDR6285580.1 putative membrane protein [Methylopila jiangsuensis]GLK75338.1 cyclic nucleotide-binding protein [Methylopila jiangsuensis]